MLFQTIAASTVPGDTNGDGIVDSSEFAVVLSHLHGNGVVLSEDFGLVLSNYWSHASAIGMTNLTGMGTPVVRFALTNYDGGTFDVDYSSNLTDWIFLGTTSPIIQFTDTNPPTCERYYRLRWP